MAERKKLQEDELLLIMSESVHSMASSGYSLSDRTEEVGSNNLAPLFLHPFLLLRRFF